jgi:predicted nucleotidyltransferase
MDVDPMAMALRIARGHFPDALSVVLGGSAAAGRATASSDLDIAVLVDDSGETSRETLRVEGRVVELFVHTRAGLAELFAADVASRRATMQCIYVSGVVLADKNGEAERARALAEADLQKGAPALSPATVETKRYILTSDLDDLADAQDRFESLAVGGQVLHYAGNLLMDHHRAWLGGGKWMPRRLLEADPVRGAALLDGHLRLCESGDATGLTDAAERVLDLVGGPLREGYRRAWEGIIESLAGE